MSEHRTIHIARFIEYLEERTKYEQIIKSSIEYETNRRRPQQNTKSKKTTQLWQPFSEVYSNKYFEDEF